MLKKKQYSMKMNDYFQLVTPEYVYLKLIPNTSIKNNKASDIAEIINGTYLEVVDKFKKHNKGFSYTLSTKVSFVIDVTKDNACFYIIVPKLHLKQFSQKLTEVFGKITIEEVEGIKPIRDNCTKYSLSCAKDDSLSLCVDKRDKNLLGANLSIMEILQDDDRVTIVYNFMPKNKASLSAWKNYHVKQIQRYYDGINLDKNLTANKVIMAAFKFAFESIDILTSSLQWAMSGNEKKQDDTFKRLIPVKDISSATKNKENDGIIDTQIILYSQSKDIKRENENAKTLVNTFSIVGEGADNKLIAKKIKSKEKNHKSIGIKKKHKVNIVKEETKKEESKYVNLEKYDLEGGEKSKFSYDEVGANFINLPGKTLIEEHHLESVAHNETLIPEELQQGTIRYGTSTYRGKDTTVTTSSDDDASCMPEIIMAKMGGGKTSTFENKGVDAVNNNDGLITIDFIKNCEMSDNIIRNIDKDKCIIIDFADYMCKEGFGFNEIEMIRNMDNAMSRYECAVLQNAQITNFIDNLGHEEFSASMGRYLDAACTAVLIHQSKSIRDIVKCLECFKTREKYMKELEEFAQDMPEEYRELIYEDLDALEELNEYKNVKDLKGKKTEEVELAGTNQGKISGIISRISMLKKNPALKFMYVRGTQNNINLAELMQQGKAIFFKLPQNRFSSPQVKNIMVSYLFSKIMIASEIRSEVYKNEKLRRVHVICDEIQQARGSFGNISEMSYQMRKFRVKLILSTHNFQKIAPIKDILIDAGATIMMLKGSSVKDFEVLKDEFEKFGFSKQDIVSLSHSDKYQALCLIATKKGRHGCIVELPKPVKNKIELNLAA